MRNITPYSQMAIMRLFAIIVVAIACTAMAMAYDFSHNGIYYNINSITGTAEVTCGSNNYNSYSGQVVIPNAVTHDNRSYAVAAVGENAFRNCSGLTAVTIGENVATIGKRSFLNCTALTTVNIPAAVTIIGDYAFAQCSNLTDVTFNNDAALELGAGAFMRCSELANVKWPSSENLDGHGGLTSVGPSAFALCSSLTSITLPGELQLLGPTVFDGCLSLNSITLTMETPIILNGDPFALDNTSSVDIYVPSSGIAGHTATLYNQAVGWRDYNIVELPYSFIDNNRLTYLKEPAGTVTVTGRLNPGNDVMTIKSTITDPKGNTYNVTSIADEAFKGTSIKSLDTSNALKLKTIGTEAFAQCTQLTNAMLREGITSMGNKTFAGCTSLTSVNVPSTIQAIPYGAFMDCSELKNVTLAVGVFTISEDAFARCTSLESIYLPRSIVDVETHAFRHATSLKHINVEPVCQHYASSDGVLFERKFGDEFEASEIGKMNKLVLYPMSKPGENFYIPCGVTTIDDNALEEAINLKNLTIPATTTTFGNECFKGTNIQNINYRNTNPSNDGTLGITAALKANATLQVPVGTIPAYNALTAWNGFKNIVECDYAFASQGIDYDWNDKFQATIVYIHHAAVDSDGVLTLPSTVTKSGYTYDITQIKNNSTRNLAQDVTQLVINSDNLSVIDTTNNLNPISTLQTLNSISVTPSNSYLKVMDNNLYSKQGDIMYYYLRSNTQQHFTIPSSVETIMPQAFASNQHLTRVTFNSNAKTVGGRAFEGCSSLQRVDNAKTIKTIAPRAFAECTALTTFIGGDRLILIDDEAFLNCYSLSHFPFSHGMIKSLGNRAFKGCSSIKAGVMGFNLENLGEAVFSNCTSLKKVFFSTKVNSMGNQMFKNCTALEELWLCNETPLNVDNNFFTQSSLKLYVPEGSVDDYSNNSPWNHAAQVNACSYLNNGPDVNGDRAINALDVTMVMSVILGDFEGEIVGHFDVNHDGYINISDITVIYDYLLSGSAASMAYSFLYDNQSEINNVIKVGTQAKIFAENRSTHTFATSGVIGYIDNPAVATISHGTNSNGYAYFEINAVAPGYCTLVAIVNDGTKWHYRTIPIVVTE